MLNISVGKLGGKTSELGSIDGISQWNSLIEGTPSNRTQLLHNIDDFFGYAGIRKENFKLIKGIARLNHL